MTVRNRSDSAGCRMTNVKLNKKLWTAAVFTLLAIVVVALGQADWAGADGTQGTGPQQQPVISFQDDQSQPLDFADLPAVGSSVNVNIAGSNLDLVAADTLQVHTTHDPGITSVHSAHLTQFLVFGPVVAPA